MEIRESILDDYRQLAPLMEQLGYPTSTEQMKQRLTYITSSPNYHTLVAIDNEKIIAMIGLVKSFYYEMDGSFIRIQAFIVDATYRNQGVGKRLLEEAEEWARSSGATGISLNSGNREERIAAHKFYEKRGYVARSIGFAKSLR
ncbi:GNAT family N-acetyltransferase [Priestia taiwanensis]|uniref:N-acetyltransferase n=1 Tax=Priestia taiwanensis TaxID=1347902 RepID=A0A917ANJ4_9BACI|nr:GNAT family N-acetyltransferase [Priestia taiwanensis]MBM7362626.1 GNAT superfamily N-acetyltransferase [Priestia taiwanensis]GGE63768.1 N-acetyltransferase [Priestia taiwanensis]